MDLPGLDNIVWGKYTEGMRGFAQIFQFRSTNAKMIQVKMKPMSEYKKDLCIDSKFKIAAIPTEDYDEGYVVNVLIIFYN